MLNHRHSFLLAAGLLMFVAPSAFGDGREVVIRREGEEGS